jgi:ornithine cyclodeaminase/alanine dehydrogenase-like protein (mu-crystallin family)
MSLQSPIWISEAEVVAMMDLGDAIKALEQGLLAEAEGQAWNMVKTHAVWANGASLHAIGATFPSSGFAGTKTWVHAGGGATPLLILFDSETGGLKTIIEAFALGQMRTASTSGLATHWLAAVDADDFAIIGTGKQAITQVAVVLAVRPLKRIRVFGRNEERRHQFASRLEKEFKIEVVSASSVEEAVKDASIITIVTRATEPLVSADMIASGAHINAVGAIVPSRAEVASDILARSTQIVVDSVPQAQKLSRELMEFCGGPGEEGWKQVKSLASLVAAQRPRGAGDDITIFKSLGMGISDLALGIELYRRAVEQKIGRKFAHPQRVTPRLHVSKKYVSA